ncbi:MAG: ATP-binding protein [Bacteroidales bacterium]
MTGAKRVKVAYQLRNRETSFLQLEPDFLQNLHFKSFLDQISSSIILFRQDGKIIYYNTPFVSLICGGLEGANISRVNIKQFEDLEFFPLKEKIHDLRFFKHEFDEELEQDWLITESYKCYRVEGREANMVHEGRNVFLINITDITPRKKFEKNLIRAKEKAEEADKLKTSFLSCMSHEIRTPMTHIIGFLDLFKDPMITELEREEYAGIMRKSGEALVYLIDNIIDIAKLESGQFILKNKTVHLNSLLSDIAEECLQVRADFNKSHISFVLDIPDNTDDFFVCIDPDRLKQVIRQLLDNAFKFTHKGLIEFGYTYDEEGVFRFFVKDTGPGIDLSLHNVIFRRFRQLDHGLAKTNSGTGLGLAIAQGIVELMGGEIKLKSEKEKGSEFFFELEPEIITRRQIENEQVVGWDSKWISKKILAVMDEAVNFNLLFLTLKEMGAQFKWVRTPMEAIESCKRNDFDLVIIDLSPYQFIDTKPCKELKHCFPNLPILAQCSQSASGFFLSEGDNDFDDWIIKPINKRLMLSKIDLLLKK